MKRATKLLVISGELLIAASLALMLSGLAMNYPSSLLGSIMSGETARKVHLVSAYLFIGLFYVHATAGIYLILGRFERLREAKTRKAVLSAWTLGIAVLLLLSLVPRGNGPMPSSVSAGTLLTVQEVARHNTENDCWIIVGNDVYNVTSLIDVHSGGREAIIRYCGRNATEVFFEKHSQNDYYVLGTYYIGTIGEPMIKPKKKISKEGDD